MDNENNFAIQNETLHISGVLHLDKAALLLQQLHQLDIADKIKFVDFSATKHCDTTGILLMLHIVRCVGSRIEFLKVPYRLRELINLSNLADKFNLH